MKYFDSNKTLNLINYQFSLSLQNMVSFVATFGQNW